MFDLFLDGLKRSLFTICSLTIFISYALFFALNNLAVDNVKITGYIKLIPVIIGSIMSFITLIIYFFWRRKQYMLIEMHMKKNYINYDTVAIVLNFFAIAILFLITIPLGELITENSIQIAILVTFAFFLLIPQGFHIFFMYRVKMDLARRRNDGKLSSGEAKSNGELTSFKSTENLSLENKTSKKDKLLNSKESNSLDRREPSAGKFYE